jgi:rRNA-processing protein FCF1
LAVDRLRSDKVGRKRKILFDSSFLIAVMEHPTAWERDLLGCVGYHQGVVILPVYEELVRLAGGGGRQSPFARLALQLVDEGRIALERSLGDSADEELVSYALREGAAVATVDRALIRQLRASRVGVVSLSRGRVVTRG